MTRFTQSLWEAKWKIVSAALALILASLSFTVWTEREFLIRRSLHNPTQVPLNAEAFALKTPQVMAELGASSAILWQVDITRNVRQSKVFNTPAGRLTDREGRKAPVFTDVPAENEFATHLINGETFCGNLITRSNLGQALLRDGIIFLCRSPIISRQKLLVGYVTIGFKERPSDELRERAAIATRMLARDLTPAN